MKKEENLEKQVKELEKSNRWMKGILLALTGIFFVGLCVGFGYILGNSNNKDNEKIEEKEDKDKEEYEEKDEDEELQLETLTKDSPVVKQLFSDFNEEHWTRYDVMKEIDKDENKRAIAYSSLKYNSTNVKEIKCNELEKSNVVVEVNGVSRDFSCSFGWDNEEATTSAVDAKYLEEKYKSMFGLNSNYKNENFMFANSLYFFDKTKKVYAQLFGVYGDERGGYSHTLDSIEQEGITLKLNTTLVNEYDSTKKSSIIYTFEYEKETGNYIFVSREEK